MRMIGCDLHAAQQTIAMLDRDTGEVVERTLTHEGPAVRETEAAQLDRQLSLVVLKRPLVAARRVAADPSTRIAPLHIRRALADRAAWHRHQRRQIRTLKPVVATVITVHSPK